MKKTLALVLSLLVAFSMFSVVASAADEQTVTVLFKNGGEIIRELEIAVGEEMKPDYFPEVTEEFETEEKDESGELKKYKHTFKGWRSDVDNELYYPGTMKAFDGSVSTVVLTAEYSVEDISGRQSFWNLIESIFARINLIFEYFATIFNF